MAGLMTRDGRDTRGHDSGAVVPKEIVPAPGYFAAAAFRIGVSRAISLCTSAASAFGPR